MDYSVNNHLFFCLCLLFIKKAVSPMVYTGSYGSGWSCNYTAADTLFIYINQTPGNKLQLVFPYCFSPTSLCLSPASFNQSWLLYTHSLAHTGSSSVFSTLFYIVYYFRSNQAGPFCTSIRIFPVCAISISTRSLLPSFEQYQGIRQELFFSCILSDAGACLLSCCTKKYSSH